jgi:hypothetical protein
LPVLNGHRYLPSAVVKDPFITTFVSSTTGFGLAKDHKITLTGFDRPLVFTGDLVYVLVGFEYQHAVKDWLSLGAEIETVGRVGANVQSAVSEGVSLVNAFGLVAKARAWHGERHILSATLGFTETGLTAFTPLKFGQAVQDGEEVPDAADELLSESDSPTPLAGLRFAYAPRPWIGLSLLVESGLGVPFDREKDDEVIFRAGASASMDFKHLSAAPVGVVLSFFEDSFAQAGNDITNRIRSVLLGLFYTGREDFTLGVETQWLYLPLVDEDEAINAFSGRLNLRYHF